MVTVTSSQNSDPFKEIKKGYDPWAVFKEAEQQHHGGGGHGGSSRSAAAQAVTQQKPVQQKASAKNILAKAYTGTIITSQKIINPAIQTYQNVGTYGGASIYRQLEGKKWYQMPGAFVSGLWSPKQSGLTILKQDIETNKYLTSQEKEMQSQAASLTSQKKGIENEKALGVPDVMIYGQTLGLNNQITNYNAKIAAYNQYVQSSKISKGEVAARLIGSGAETAATGVLGGYALGYAGTAIAVEDQGLFAGKAMTFLTTKTAGTLFTAGGTAFGAYQGAKTFTSYGYSPITGALIGGASGFAATQATIFGAKLGSQAFLRTGKPIHLEIEERISPKQSIKGMRYEYNVRSATVQYDFLGHKIQVNQPFSASGEFISIPSETKSTLTVETPPNKYGVFGRTYEGTTSREFIYSKEPTISTTIGGKTVFTDVQQIGTGSSIDFGKFSTGVGETSWTKISGSIEKANVPFSYTQAIGQREFATYGIISKGTSGTSFTAKTTFLTPGELFAGGTNYNAQNVFSGGLPRSSSFPAMDLSKIGTSGLTRTSGFAGGIAAQNFGRISSALTNIKSPFNFVFPGFLTFERQQERLKFSPITGVTNINLQGTKSALDVSQISGQGLKQAQGNIFQPIPEPTPVPIPIIITPTFIGPSGFLGLPPIPGGGIGGRGRRRSLLFGQPSKYQPSFAALPGVLSKKGIFGKPSKTQTGILIRPMQKRRR